MSDEVRAVEFVAEVRQVKTMADGTVNLTLNLPEYCKPQAAWFMQHQGEMVKEVSILESLTDLNDEAKEETEGSVDSVGHRRIRDRRDQRESGEIQAAV
jgi:hypothetical protein